MTQPFGEPEEECEETPPENEEESLTPHEEDDDPEAQAGEPVDVELPEVGED